jgi:hypothetical protein
MHRPAHPNTMPGWLGAPISSIATVEGSGTAATRVRGNRDAVASRCRRYRSGRLQALDDNPELLVIGPASSPAGLNNLEPFDLSTALMAVNKHSFTSINLNQQGGLNRRETHEGYARIHKSQLASHPTFEAAGCSL